MLNLNSKLPLKSKLSIKKRQKMPLSTKQMEYLALAWQCFESEPKIDYNKFHQLAGLKSSHCAREILRVTKKKLKAEYGAVSITMRASNSNAGTPKKNANSASLGMTPAPSTGKKRGRKAEDVAIGDVKVEDESPTKKARNGATSIWDDSDCAIMAGEVDEDELI